MMYIMHNFPIPDVVQVDNALINLVVMTANAIQDSNWSTEFVKISTNVWTSVKMEIVSMKSEVSVVTVQVVMSWVNKIFQFINNADYQFGSQIFFRMLFC